MESDVLSERTTRVEDGDLWNLTDSDWSHSFCVWAEDPHELLVIPLIFHLLHLEWQTVNGVNWASQILNARIKPQDLTTQTTIRPNDELWIITAWQRTEHDNNSTNKTGNRETINSNTVIRLIYSCRRCIAGNSCSTSISVYPQIKLLSHKPSRWTEMQKITWKSTLCVYLTLWCS